jgi:hypothetical protein
MTDVRSSRRTVKGGWVLALGVGQLGCLVGVLAFRICPVCAASGLYLRSGLSSLFGWDRGDTHLYTTAAAWVAWSPTLVMLGIAMTAALFAGGSLRFSQPLETLVNLLVPWIILVLTTASWAWKWVALCVLPLLVVRWLYDIGAGLVPRRAAPTRRHGAPWSLLLSIPFWLLILQDVHYTLVPISLVSVALGLARLVVWRLDRDATYRRNETCGGV